MEAKESTPLLAALERKVRALQIATLVGAALLAGLIAALFHCQSGAAAAAPPRELTVERINVVEPDGTLRLVVSNRERAPDPVIDGLTLPRQGSRPAGLIFYNDEGDESGGLIYNSDAEARESGAALLFDRYKQDQILGLMYQESEGAYAAGMRVWDRPPTPISSLAPIIEMPDGPEKEARIAEMAEAGELGAQRLFAGRFDDGSAGLALFDKASKLRLMLAVDESGGASLELYDAAGNVTHRFPEAPAR